MTTITTLTRATTVFCLLGLALSAAGCASSNSETPAPEAGLPPEMLTACRSILGDDARDHDQGNTVLVYDHTGSVSAEEEDQVPASLKTALTDASLADGSLTVIVVDGRNVAPRIALKNGSLSIPQTKTTLWNETQADAMATCVLSDILPKFVPSAPGTDFGRAMALAAEMVTPKTQLVVWSDWLWTTGAGALDADKLSSDSSDAGAASARALPLNMKGATLVTAGVGNTSAPILSAQRGWLRDYAQALCEAWHASGCDAIAVDPVNAVSSARSLPKDPMPDFPAVDFDCAAGKINYELPSALLFLKNSSTVRDEATELLNEPIQLLEANPSATVEVDGYASTDGGKKANQVLSENRAKNVANAMLRALPGRQITWRGLGELKSPRPEQARIVRIRIFGIDGGTSCSSH